MGNLCFRDFRVLGRYLYCGLLAIVLWPSTPSHSAMRLDVTEIRPQRGNIVLAQLAERDKLKNIQRLLTLLSERYKEKYGSVNPGKVDGSYGAETKAAIREYQRISGVEQDGQSLDLLTADILATLAQMSAEQPAEDNSAATAETPMVAPAVALADTAAAKPEPGNMPAGTEKGVAGPPSDKPAPGSTSAPPADVSKTDSAPVAPTPPAPAAAPPSETPNPDNAPAQRDYGAPVPPARTTMPAAASENLAASRPTVAETQPAGTNDRVYFSQLASLRSLPSAQREWQRIFDANRAALTGEQVYFEEVDIAGRGIFHRILVGPISERESAIKLCGFLRQNDQPCVVILRLLSDLRRLRDQSLNLVPVLPPPSDRPPGRNETPTLAQDKPTPQNPAQTSAHAAAEPVPAAEQIPLAEPPAPPSETTAALTAAPSAARPSDGNPASAAADQASPPETITAAPTETSIGTSMPPAATTTESKSSESLVRNAPPPDAALPAPADRDAPATATVIDLSPPTEAASNEQSPPPPAAATIDLSPPEGTGSTPQTATILPFPRMQPKAQAGASGSGPAPDTSHGAPDAGQATTAGPTPANANERGLATGTSGAQSGVGLLPVVIGGLVAAAGLVALVLWRRNRSAVLSQILSADDGPDVRSVVEASTPADALKILESDFEGPQLRQSRSIRDEFLRDILGHQINAGDAPETKEPAIRINSSLKSLLVSDPAKYKTIFLNWIFLSKVGSALTEREITMGDIDSHFGREFNILENYFKIHLLELDDRHRIRKELPGLFYCLQLAQQKQRDSGRAPSAA